MRAPAVWQRLRRDRLATCGLVVLSALLLVALLADLLAGDLPILARFKGELFVLPAVTRPPALQEYDNQRLRREISGARGDWALMPLCEYGPEQQPEILRLPPASPDGTHWLGTDDRGRDVLARLVHGARVSLAVGLFSVALHVLFGVTLGVMGGYFRGWVDAVVSRLIEVGLTFPTFFLILVIMALQDRPSLMAIIVVLGLTRWTDVARLTRAEALRLRELTFVSAARGFGAGPLRIIWRHILPHAAAPVMVNATFGVAGAMVVEAALTFLGFGTPPPTASWGEVLSQGYELQSQWWLILCPGGLLFVTVTALNLLAEGLQDALDPRALTAG